MSQFMCKQTGLFLFLFFGLALLPEISKSQNKPEQTEILGHTMYTLLKPGDIPAIFSPEFIGAKEAAEFYYPEEPLIVVEGTETINAYSTWHLDHHEVVNDNLDGNAIAVTW